MTLKRSLLDVIISILIDLLTGLVGALVRLNGPTLALSDGRRMPAQFSVALRDYFNARGALIYWNGVLSNV